MREPEDVRAQRRTEDAALLARIVEKDERAVEALYARYSGPLYSLAYQVTGAERFAQDVVQEVFVALWRDATRFDPERGALAPWLFSLARHKAIDLVRREANVRKRTADVDLELREADDDVDHETWVRFRRERVLEAIEELTPVQREALELAFFEGLTHVEVAERVGIPLGTAKTRIRSALLRLRDILGDSVSELPGMRPGAVAAHDRADGRTTSLPPEPSWTTSSPEERGLDRPPGRRVPSAAASRTTFEGARGSRARRPGPNPSARPPVPAVRDLGRSQRGAARRRRARRGAPVPGRSTGPADDRAGGAHRRWPIDAARARRATTRLAVAVLGLAAAFAIAAVGLGARSIALQRDIDQAGAQVAGLEERLAGRGDDLAMDPGHVAVALQAEALAPARRPPSCTCRGRTARIVADHLPATPSGQGYQLWYADAAGVHPLQTVAFDGNGAFVAPLEVDLAKAAAVMITLEDAGGATGDPGPQVVFGEL